MLLSSFPSNDHTLEQSLNMTDHKLTKQGGLFVFDVSFHCTCFRTLLYVRLDLEYLRPSAHPRNWMLKLLHSSSFRSLFLAPHQTATHHRTAPPSQQVHRIMFGVFQPLYRVSWVLCVSSVKDFKKTPSLHCMRQVMIT